MLVGVDAAALEWRVCVELAKDYVGIDEIVGGLDTHTRNQEAFDLPSRSIAKKYLFRTIYRGSGYAFSVDPEFMHVSKNPKFWDDIGEKFYSKYHGINSWHMSMAEKVSQGTDIVTPFGRKWNFELKRNYRGELELPWTVFTNYPVQGTGADVMTIARVSFRNRLRKLGWPVLLISTVHDSIVVDCPDDYVERVTKLFYDVFDDLVTNIRRLFKYDWETPLDGEVKYGPNMNDMKKLLRKDL